MLIQFLKKCHPNPKKQYLTCNICVTVPSRIIIIFQITRAQIVSILYVLSASFASFSKVQWKRWCHGRPNRRKAIAVMVFLFMGLIPIRTKPDFSARFVVSYCQRTVVH